MTLFAEKKTVNYREKGKSLPGKKKNGGSTCNHNLGIRRSGLGQGDEIGKGILDIKKGKEK